MNLIHLRNAMLIDGAGAPPLRGDLLIEGERIAAIGRFEAPGNAAELDCTGLAACPGFVDAHSHLDLQVLEDRQEKIRQGVTAEVVGNCGFSPYPVSPERRKELHDFANGILCGNSDWGWATARDYLDDVERAARTGAVSLVGHGTLRIAHAGSTLGPLSPRVLEAMEQALDEALAQGAGGLSTGLMYSPGASAPFNELERLCRVVAKRGKVYAVHLRDYQAKLPAAVDEQIALAKSTGCKVQISHFQAVGPENWEKQPAAIERIERASREGVDIAFDCYPYTSGSSVLTMLLPLWALEGGVDRMCERLADPAERLRIAGDAVDRIPQRWTDIYISATGSRTNQELIGETIAEIAVARGTEPIDVVIELLLEERGDAHFISFNQSEQNLRAAVTHPLSIVASDASYVKGRPHPRLYGAFPRLLGHMVRENKWLPLQDAVHKITDRPARRFGFTARGRLGRGFFADIVLFDPAKVNSYATYENPEVYPVGIRAVFRNGKLLAGSSWAA